VAFTSVPFTSDVVTLADQAVDRLTARWPTWEPSDADLEVIQISVLAPIAQSAIEVAAVVPDAIFRAYGTKLIGLPYTTGAPALGVATIAALDNAGYTSSPFTIQFGLNGQGAETDAVVVIPPGSTSVDVDFHMLDSGTTGNGLSGTADLITAMPWIDSITVSVPNTTAGGSDPEDDKTYQDRLAERLQLRADTLVTGRDFELIAVASFPTAIARASAVVGTARAVTVAVISPTGGNVTTPIKDQLLALYDQYRQVNTTYSVIDPTRTNITVTATIVVAPGYVPSDVRDLAIAAVQQWLSPLEWGKTFDQRYDHWINETKVRYNELIRVLGVQGVRYVAAATLNGGTADITMTGTVTLPTLVGTPSITATT